MTHKSLVTVIFLIGFSLLSPTRLCAQLNEQQLTASDGAFGDGFGHSVAFSGSTVVVGAWIKDIDGNSHQGAVYVFNRRGESWVETQKLTASDGAAEDNFGWSVAVSGSTIVVGAWRDDIGGNTDQGSAYVFSLKGGSWVETQKLTATGAAGDNFGWLAAISGTTIFVSAIGDNFGHGAVHVFNRQGGNWVEEQKLTASDGASGDAFGQSIAISGSTLVAGSPGDDLFRGSIYVFNRQGGSWIEEQKLTASDGAPVDFFGFSAAISGSTIVVGSIGEDLGSQFDQGAAYVFHRQGGSWVEQQKLIASVPGPSDFFGWSVAISNSTIVVGVPFEKISGSNTAGSAYVFNRQGADWLVTEKLTPSNGEANDFFSFSAAVGGSTIVVGSENSGNIGQGSVYIFEL